MFVSFASEIKARGQEMHKCAANDTPSVHVFYSCCAFFCTRLVLILVGIMEMGLAHGLEDLVLWWKCFLTDSANNAWNTLDGGTVWMSRVVAVALGAPTVMFYYVLLGRMLAVM